MSELLERHAQTADQIVKGQISPGVAFGAEMARYSSETEFRARRMFNAAMSRFRSDIQDCAALSHAFDTQLIRFMSIVTEHAPTAKDWDEAMARKEGQQ